jgi:hypothetical protein
MAQQAPSKPSASAMQALPTLKDSHTQTHKSLPIARTVVKHTAPAGRCRFLELPGELRNKIYDYVFPNSHDLVVSPNHVQPLALLHTCRQIYLETSILHYLRSTFHFTSLESLASWKGARTAQQLKAVSRIVVSLDLRQSDSVDYRLFEGMSGLEHVLLKVIKAKDADYEGTWDDVLLDLIVWQLEDHLDANVDCEAVQADSEEGDRMEG